ncbi:MAG: 2-enoyl thioester reductase domain-containing protein [Akkermansia sp.]
MNRYAQFNQCGQPQDVLSVATAPIPTPADGELLVEMLAAPINPADINFVQGVYGLKPQFPDSVAGLEGFGVVKQSQSPDYQVGDQVILLNGVGAWAQFLCAPAADFIKIPQQVDPMQACMLKVNPLTAWLALTQYVTLQEGDWVVQNAANSGVGRCVIQLCKAMGLRSINIVRKPDELRDELMSLGADIVVGEDDADLVKSVIAATGGVRPKLASNCVGGDSATRLMDMLAPAGTMVTFGAMSKKSIKVPNGFLIFKNISLRGLWCTQWVKNATHEQVLDAYMHLADIMAAGKLTQAIDSVYSIDDIQSAALKAQEEYRSGKVLLKLKD